MSLAVEMDMRPLVAHCHYGLGRLYQRVSQAERARESVTAAAALYSELDMPFYARKAQRASWRAAVLTDDRQHTQ